VPIIDGKSVLCGFGVLLLWCCFGVVCGVCVVGGVGVVRRGDESAGCSNPLTWLIVEDRKIRGFSPCIGKPAHLGWIMARWTRTLPDVGFVWAPVFVAYTTKRNQRCVLFVQETVVP